MSGVVVCDTTTPTKYESTEPWRSHSTVLWKRGRLAKKAGLASTGTTLEGFWFLGLEILVRVLIAALGATTMQKCRKLELLMKAHVRESGFRAKLHEYNPVAPEADFSSQLDIQGAHIDSMNRAVGLSTYSLPKTHTDTLGARGDQDDI